MLLKRIVISSILISVHITFDSCFIWDGYFNIFYISIKLPFLFAFLIMLYKIIFKRIIIVYFFFRFFFLYTVLLRFYELIFCLLFLQIFFFSFLFGFSPFLSVSFFQFFSNKSGIRKHVYPKVGKPINPESPIAKKCFTFLIIFSSIIHYLERIDGHVNNVNKFYQNCN